MSYKAVIDLFDIGLISVVLGAITGYLTNLYFKSRGILSFQYSRRIHKSAGTQNTLLVFWNSGNKVIDYNEISSIDPLRIRCNKDGSIKEVNILKTSRDANDFKYEFSPDGEEIILKFDYLNPKDGFVIELLNKRVFLPKILGEIKGGKLSNNGSMVFLFGNIESKILCLFLLSSSTFLLLIYKLTGSIAPAIGSREGLYIFVSLGYLGSLFSFHIMNRSYPSKLKPNEMENYVIKH